MYQVPVVTCRDQIGSYRSDCPGTAMVTTGAPGSVTIPLWLLAVGVVLLLMASNKRGNG